MGSDRFEAHFRGFGGPDRSSLSRVPGIRSIRSSLSRVRGAWSELISDGSWDQIDLRLTFEGLEDLVGANCRGFVEPDRFGVHFQGFVGPLQVRGDEGGPLGVRGSPSPLAVRMGCRIVKQPEPPSWSQQPSLWPAPPKHPEMRLRFKLSLL